MLKDAHSLTVISRIFNRAYCGKILSSLYSVVQDNYQANSAFHPFGGRVVIHGMDHGGGDH